MKSDDETSLVYDFSLVAPALNNYRLSLFWIIHKAVNLYPVTICSDFLSSNKALTKWFAANETSFRGNLKRIFGAAKVTNAIQSLLAQSEGYKAPEEDDIPF